MDVLHADALKPADYIHVPAPNGGPLWQKVKSVRQVDPGITSPIYAIEFYSHGFELFCDGEREFEVEHTEPAELTVARADSLFQPR